MGETPEHGRIEAVPSSELRKPLKWGLGATLALTAVAIFWPKAAVVENQGHSESMDVQPGNSSPRSVASAAPVPDHAAAGIVTPRRVASSTIAEAPSTSLAPQFDPFVGVQSQPPPSPAPIANVQTAQAVTAPPMPPPQDYRFLGRMRGPDGVQQIMLTKGELAVPIHEGMVLDNGYVIESITSDKVVLSYGSSEAKVVIPLPAERPSE